MKRDGPNVVCEDVLKSDVFRNRKSTRIMVVKVTTTILCNS